MSGKSNEQIATALCLSVGTIKNTVTRVFRKLGVHNRTEALVAAFGTSGTASS